MKLICLTLLLAGCIFEPEKKPGKTYIVDPETCNHIAGHDGKDSIICDLGEPRPPKPQ